jgi:hypothetical protein
MHKLKELVDISGLEVPDDFPREVACFDGAVQFDFGNVTRVSGDEWLGLQGYALDLMNESMFHMPFERCFYSFRADHIDFSASIFERADKLFLLILASSDDLPAAVSSFAMIWNGPHDMPGRFKLAHSSAVNKKSRFAFWDEGKRVAFLQEHAIVCVRDICALTTMLSAKGVEQIITPAPHKLNKHRVKRGLPSIGEVREIVIHHGKNVYAASGQQRGSHASPRMHWRRGHLRRLPSGEITNVRPCLVGSVGEAVKPSYVVRAA